jgi:predicted MPP superfamily phosphohydrolase
MAYSLPITLFQLNILTLAGTLFLTIISYRNAFLIHIEHHIVKIKNLPSAWEGKRVIHISDVHLGPILRQDFFKKVIRRIEAMKPDAVFITGDLFDGSESDFSWVSSPLNNLKAPFGLYYSFGNHDFTLGHDRVTELLKGENITILDNLLVEMEGVQIIGLNFTPDRNFDLKRAVLASTGYDPIKPSIVLFHEPKDTAKLKGIGVDLLLAGHTHGGQMFPFNYLASYFYHNHSHGIYRDRDFTLCVSSGVGTWGPPMRTGSKSEIIELTLHKK